MPHLFLLALLSGENNDKEEIMYDQYNRKIDYLRISITDRCNLHCQYCQPEVTQHVAHEDILRYEDILRICSAAVQLGISKFKVTGGEPLLRSGCTDFIMRLKDLAGVEQVTLTTNGIFLPRFLPALKKAEIDCVNISLDTTDSEFYRRLTGGALDDVMRSLELLQQAGIPFKINCVALAEAGVNNILSLLALADKYDVPLRFIELMPLACNINLQGVSGRAVRSWLEQRGSRVIPDRSIYGNGPASYYRVTGYKIPVGFIEPLHNKFCGVCNRVRLTSVGLLKPCLYSDAGADLKQLLRSGASDDALLDTLHEVIKMKPSGHRFEDSPGIFNMNQIGG